MGYNLLLGIKKTKTIFQTRQQAVQYCKQHFRNENPDIHIRRIGNGKWAVNE